MAERRVPVAVIGTSWWADAMYLPALEGSRVAQVVAVCGRNRERTEAFARRWRVPRVFTDWEALLASAECEAVLVVTPNDTHHPIVMAALEQGMHVLCEKPLALKYRQAREMAQAADAKGLTTMMPFTYRYMPTTRFLKQLVDGGYLGRPYHLNLRYYSSYGRDGAYLWRMDLGRAGSGVLGDLGSHFLHLAEWFFGDIETVTAVLSTLVQRPARDPAGSPFQPADDTAAIILGFRNGAQGMVQVSAVAYEDTPFGQVHAMDLHGSGGTLRQVIDWDRLQHVWGAREGEGPLRPIEVPEEMWGGAPHESVKDTYHDVFRRQGFMIGEFVMALAAGRMVRPDFRDGARLQAVLEAALRSDREGRRVTVSEVSE